jgi:hypothetical protein
MFKTSDWWKKSPNTDNTGVKTEHQLKQLVTKMKFIEQTTLTSKQKRKVLVTSGEVERLLRVLFHDLKSKVSWKTKGQSDDESD